MFYRFLIGLSVAAASLICHQTMADEPLGIDKLGHILMCRGTMTNYLSKWLHTFHRGKAVMAPVAEPLGYIWQNTKGIRSGV